MKGKTSVSAIVLSYNEAPRIHACLDALSWANEVIVVDNGSTDETVAIAHKVGAVVVSDNAKDFASQRNLGLKHAKGEWLLYIDADEIVTAELQKEIQECINDPTENYSGFFVSRRNFYLGREWPYRDRLIRLMRKNSLKTWVGILHEHPVIKGKIGELKNPVIHDTHRTIEEMVVKTNEWSDREAILRLASGHPPVVWWRLFRVFLTAFYESFIQQKGYRAGAVGWIESTYQAFSMFITYAKLWEMQREQAGKTVR